MTATAGQPEKDKCNWTLSTATKRQLTQQQQDYLHSQDRGQLGYESRDRTVPARPGHNERNLIEKTSQHPSQDSPKRIGSSYGKGPLQNSRDRTPGAGQQGKGRQDRKTRNGQLKQESRGRRAEIVFKNIRFPI
jgi:hypothetical protein